MAKIGRLLENVAGDIRETAEQHRGLLEREALKLLVERIAATAWNELQPNDFGVGEFYLACGLDAGSNKWLI